MAFIDIPVPDLGDIADAAIIEILVKPGQTVAAEQSLITLESDKASMEIPSSHAGVVKELKVALGDKVSRRPAIGEYRRSIVVFAVESAQFGIGGGDRDRQHEPGLRGIDHRRAGLRGRRCMGGAVAPPQV